MINQIIGKFISQILENNTSNLSEIVSEVFKFSEQILENEIAKILPIENSKNMENEIFAVLFSIGDNSRQLKKIGFSDQEIIDAFKDYFDKAKNSDFIKSLQIKTSEYIK